MKQWIGWMLTVVLCMMLLVPAAAESGLTLPGQMTVVEKEAFAYDTSLTTAQVPHGATHIGQRAFAYSSLEEITLPFTLQEIAPDAFEGCRDLHAWVYAGSYAQIYCEKYQIPYGLIQDNAHTLYSIDSLTLENGAITAVVTAQQACTLKIQLKDEGQQSVQFAAEAIIPEGVENHTVTTPLPEAFILPEHYMIVAALYDAQGNLLCEPYVALQYTSAYESFEQSTPDDYEENEVLDLGDAGFGVLVDGAKRITADVRAEGASYTFASDSLPQPGDVLLLSVDGQWQPVLVLSAQRNDGGSVTVIRDPDVGIGDLFKALKMNAAVDVGAAAVRSGQARAVEDTPRDEDNFGQQITFTLKKGALTFTFTGKISVVVKAFYNEEIYGKEYFENESYVEVKGTGKMTLSKKYTHKDLPVDTSFTVFSGAIPLDPAGCSSVGLTVGMPLEFEFEAGGVITAELNMKTGYKHVSTTGTRKINTVQPKLSFDGTAGYWVQIGPKISLNGNLLWGLLQASIEGQVGGRKEGKLVVPVVQAYTGPKVHACNACIESRAYLFGDVSAKVSVRLGKKFGKDLVKLTIIRTENDLGRSYLSIANSPDSVFKGEKADGEGECPNFVYRTEFLTYDMLGNPLEGKAVQVERGGVQKAEGITPFHAYLYDGDYTASAEFDSGTTRKDFTILRKGVTVNVQEEHIFLYGNVYDAATGDVVPGAKVRLTFPDGSTMTANTNADGYYQMIFAPEESISVLITADGYADWTTTYTPQANGPKNLDAQLKPDRYTLRFDANGGSGSMEAMTAKAGEPIILPACGFNPPVGQYGFEAWEIGGVKYQPGQAYVSPAGDQTARAVWGDYYVYNGHRYKVIDRGMTWSQASSACSMVGGYLCTITSAGEQAFIQSIIAKGSQNQYWLGGYCGSDGRYAWVTGEPFGYTHWDRIEPNNYRENESYVQILRIANPAVYGSYAYGWNDINNASYIEDEANYFSTSKVGYICEWGSLVTSTVQVQNVQELRSAVASGQTALLTNDIVVTDDFTSSGFGKSVVNQTNGGVIDGNGYSLIVEAEGSGKDCAIYTTGGTIKNLTVKGAFRGIYSNAIERDLHVDNCYLDDVGYTFNAGTAGPYNLRFTNTTFNGWTSFINGYQSVSFTDCSFGWGTGRYNEAYCRPYGDVAFTRCAFAAGYVVDATPALENGGDIDFFSCTYGGEALNSSNIRLLIEENGSLSNVGVW